MSPDRMTILLKAMIACGGVSALPVRLNWPIHRAVAWLGSSGCKSSLGVSFATRPDPGVGLCVDGVEVALASLVDEGYLRKVGSGYTARWVVNEAMTPEARRILMSEQPAAAALIVQAGQRLAALASIALKNAESAATSWSETVIGSMPTDRHPPLVAVR